ncbi:MAG: amidase [Myxococcales bacterium]|nr:amidase [Myxococcales bacterium]
MLIVSADALRLAARVLDNPWGRRALGRTLLDLTDRPLPLPFVEQLANARPERWTTRVAAEPFASRPAPTNASTGAATETPLEGATVVVKESLDVEGLPSALGLDRATLDDLAREDAELVARIRAAGGVILAKTKMTELGMDGLGLLVSGEPPRNPVAPSYVVGGSSTGTAVAVASGLARYGVGGDGLGSVRIPAAFTGLVGLKPGTDVVSSRGYRSVAPTMDVPGPMARDAADCVRLFQVMAGLPVRPLGAHVPARVGVIEGLGPELAARDVRRAFERALDGLGVERVSVQVEGAASHPALALAASTRELARSRYVPRIRSAQGRMNVVFGRAFGEHDDRIDGKLRVLAEDTARALERVPLLAMPTTAVPAPAVRRGLLRGGQDALLLRAIAAYTPLANCTGLPAIAAPCGRDAAGRPLSIMFMGPPGSEELLLQVALAVEATGLGATPLDAA